MCTLDPLVEVMEGKRYVHAHCYRADEILMLIRVANEFGFKVRTFQHVLEGYKIADEIAASGAGGSTFSDWWAYKMEAYDAIPYNAALMTERGVIVSVNSDDAQEARAAESRSGEEHEVWRAFGERCAEADHAESRDSTWALTVASVRLTWARMPTWRFTITIR